MFKFPLVTPIFLDFNNLNHARFFFPTCRTGSGSRITLSSLLADRQRKLLFSPGNHFKVTVLIYQFKAYYTCKYRVTCFRHFPIFAHNIEMPLTSFSLARLHI